MYYKVSSILFHIPLESKLLVSSTVQRGHKILRAHNFTSQFSTALHFTVVESKVCSSSCRDR